MKNIFSRIKYTVTADIHELLDNKEQKNPLAMLNQYLRECERETEKVRSLFERQSRLKEEFTREYMEAQRLAEKRAHQVEVASQAGEVELYDFVLAEKNQYEARAERLKEAAEAAGKQLDELERKYAKMKHKLKDMHLKRLEIMGRENVARANYRINKVLDTDQAMNNSTARFDEMENYITRLEDQVNTNYYRNTIDVRIAELEKQAKNNESDLIS
ncbi:PspA/IM30 family protein [Bacillus massiliigorillae]|uniref:PspA/IM30 family protein n=1 Tax=Bacillus massiliigorillae TaxID=1243664 RepID=UPI00039DC2FD|nr:PspA/IM30 family protein [Bacillus massiliigorillae]